MSVAPISLFGSAGAKLKEWHQSKAPRPQAGSVRTHLFALIAACIIPTTAVITTLLWLEWDRGQQRLARDVTLTTRALVQAIDNEVLGLQAALTLLANSPLLRTGDLAGFREQATRAKDVLELTNMTLNAPDGRQLLNLQRSPGVPLPVHSAAADIVKAAQTGRPVLTDLFYNQDSSAHLVALFIPVVQDGQVVAVVGGSLDSKRIGRVFDRQKLPASWVAAVYDARRRTAARTHEAERFIGRVPRSETLASMGTAREGAFQGVTLQGTPVLSAYSLSPSSGWTVIIGIPRAELQQEMVASLRSAVSGVLLVLVASLGVAVVIGRRISSSMQRLNHTAEAIGRGVRPPDEALGFREATQLNRALVQAANAIHQSAHALTASEKRLRGILESAIDAVVTLNDQHRIVMFNDAAEQMFQIGRAEMLGQEVTRLLPERFRTHHADRIRAFGAQRGASRLMAPGRQIYGARASGEEFPIEASISCSEDGEGGLVYTIIMRDISERIRDRDALVRSNLELQQFAFIASHDLRSPLATIGGYLTLLRRRLAGHGGPAVENLVDRAIAASRDMEQLTSDLLTYARLQGDAAPLAALDAGQVVRTVLEQHAASIEERAATVRVAQMPQVQGDRAQLVQLFKNLLENALKYHHGRPMVEIGAREGESEWVFYVRDDGIGMEEKHLSRIFDIFARLHTAQEFSGTGIGLAVCKRIVERHGGRIWAESQPGAGTTMWFTLAKTV